jgi:hypothetical protein
MPLSKLLAQDAYTSEEMALMQEVFRKACPQLDNSATDRERAAQEEKLARALVVLFGSGLRDPDQLGRSALHIVAGL